MKLQILIPHTNEPESSVRKLLDSIADQIQTYGREVGVIIVENGVNSILSRKLTARYPFKIDYYILSDELSPLHVRDACMERATADYVMFCDANDFLMGTSGISYILKSIDRYYFELFSPAFYCRFMNDAGGYSYGLCDDDDAVCGKVYKLSFVRNNNITWATYGVEFNKECRCHSNLFVRDSYAYYVSNHG